MVAECFAAMRSRDERSPEVEANASLIAAAPDLLAALQEIEEFTRDVPDDEPLSHVCGTARIAIAKAVSP